MNHFAAKRQFVGACTVILSLLSLFGCRSTTEVPFDPNLDHYKMVASEIEFPDVGGEDLRIALLFQFGTDKVLEFLANDGSLG